ncbi:MAG: YoaK family protein [Vulcanimicrobiaceae bacterium]
MRYGPLPTLLGLLTLVTGFVDAVSYLKFGHVFVANMTGNVVLLGFAVAGEPAISISGSLVALAAFVCGAILGGRLNVRFAKHRGNLLAIATAVKTPLLLAAAAVAYVAPSNAFAILAALGVTMGLQNAVARKLAVPDVTTTVLTLTLTGLAADSSLAGGENPRWARRASAIVTMFGGALLGAWIVLHAGVPVALLAAAAIVAAAGIGGYVLGRHDPQWVRPA